MELEKLERERTQLISKMSELQQEQREHELVLEAFGKVAPTRRCFRLVGGVLVEQTVADVQPAITENKQRLESFLEKLGGLLKEKGQAIEKANASGSSGKTSGTRRQQAEPESKSVGVLV
jgi:prefoldin subunit 2